MPYLTGAALPPWYAPMAPYPSSSRRAIILQDLYTEARRRQPYDVPHQTAPSEADLPARPGRDDVASAARFDDPGPDPAGETRPQTSDSVGAWLHSSRLRDRQ